MWATILDLPLNCHCCKRRIRDSAYVSNCDLGRRLIFIRLCMSCLQYAQTEITNAKKIHNQIYKDKFADECNKDRNFYHCTNFTCVEKRPRCNVPQSNLKLTTLARSQSSLTGRKNWRYRL